MGHLLTVLQKKKITVQDGFNRADNASSLGNANTGQTWTPVVGTWGIINNQAYVVVTGGTDTAIVDGGKSDSRVEVTFSISATFQRLFFRFTDTSNHLFVHYGGSSYDLYKRVAGVATLLGSYTTTPANGDKIRVVAARSLIKVYINGVERISVNETFNQTATKYGIGSNASGGTERYDNFIAEEL